MTPQSTLSLDDAKRIDAYWHCQLHLGWADLLARRSAAQRAAAACRTSSTCCWDTGEPPRVENFIYAHLNRVIEKYDLNMIYVSGPGHGGPAVVGNAYLEGTYSEVYPNISQDGIGLKRLFTQFSFPGGIPSHASPECPGSIHEGGDTGYSLSHSFGAVLDNPDLIVACVVGDGESETGPLATAWHSNKFLNPATNRASCDSAFERLQNRQSDDLARISHAELQKLLKGTVGRRIS